MELRSFVVREEGGDCDGKLEDCLCNFCFGFVWEFDAPWFVKCVCMFVKLASQFGADDVDFCAVVEEEFVWFVLNEYCSVFEV